MGILNGFLSVFEGIVDTNAVFIVGVAILAAYLIDGWRKGFLNQIIQTAALLVSIIATKYSYGYFADFIIKQWNPAIPEKTINLIVIVVVFFIVLAIVEAVAGAMKLFNKVPVLGLINRLLGVGFALIRFAVLAGFTYLILLTIRSLK